MINILTKGIQILSEEFAQYQQLRINVENESHAMSCGAFNPRFIAKIRRSKASNNTDKNKEK